MLRKGSLLCIYGTVFTTFRHQSIYWLPKHAIKDVPPFSLYNSADSGWPVQACSRVQNPVRHEPALPATGHAWSPKQRLCNTCPFICTTTWREGVKQMDRASPFSVMPSDRTKSEMTGANWNRRMHLNTSKHVLLEQVACTTQNPPGNTPRHPALGGPPRAGAWGQIISTGFTWSQPFCGTVTLRWQQE